MDLLAWAALVYIVGYVIVLGLVGRADRHPYALLLIAAAVLIVDASLDENPAQLLCGFGAMTTFAIGAAYFTRHQLWDDPDAS